MKRIEITENTRHRDPFVVPEGYFESLAQRIGERIDEQEQAKVLTRSSKVARLRRWSVAASIVAVAGATMWWTMPQGHEADDIYAPLFAEDTTDDDWDAALDYAMIGNEDISYYLTEAY